MNIRVATQVVFYILPVKPHVGEIPTIDRERLIHPLFLVVPIDFFASAPYIIRDKANLRQFFQLLVPHETDGRLLHEYRTLQPSTAGILHPSPVLERVRHQRVWRYSGDGFIKVLYLHGGERNLHYIAISPIFRHCNPVAYPHHIVGGHLQAGHESQDGIFKDQHQYSRCRPQTSNNSSWVLSCEDRKKDDKSDKIEHYLHHLRVAVQWLVLQAR